MDFLREGFRGEEKTEKVWSFAKPGGEWAVSEGSKKPNLYFGV